MLRWWRGTRAAVGHRTAQEPGGGGGGGGGRGGGKGEREDRGCKAEQAALVAVQMLW